MCLQGKYSNSNGKSQKNLKKLNFPAKSPAQFHNRGCSQRWHEPVTGRGQQAGAVLLAKGMKTSSFHSYLGH
jgi:hypothetical protein